MVVDELEVDYEELIRSHILTDDLGEEKPVSTSNFEEIDTKPKVIERPFDTYERLNYLEIVVDDIQRSITLLNQTLNSHIEKTAQDFKLLEREIEVLSGKVENIDKRFEDREREKNLLVNELSSLKLVVERVNKINEEIRTKTPVFIRELEKRVDEVSNSLKKMREEENTFDKPIVLE
ncbi:MAG: hypothetical protein QXY45_03535 [Candidatus Aenigmatarchaeota archaeon]